MGLIDKLKSKYDYYKVDKYTKRRFSKSQFESHDRQYYQNAYRDGDYVDPQDVSRSNSPNSTYLTYRQSRWLFPDLLKRSSSRKSPTVAVSQLKTSETYTFGGREF